MNRKATTPSCKALAAIGGICYTRDNKEPSACNMRQYQEDNMDISGDNYTSSSLNDDDV